MNEGMTDFLNESIGCINRLRDRNGTIKKIIELLREYKDIGYARIFVCGNGGSASTASHFVSDLNKKAGVRAICLNDNIPLITAITNDIGWDYVYAEQLKRLSGEALFEGEYGDILIVISTRGGVSETGIHSKNLIKAVEYMNGIGGVTIGLSGAGGGYFDKCHINLIVDSESIPVIESIHSLICHLISWEI